MNNILVLRIGNICRSPVAEAVFKQQFPEKKSGQLGWQHFLPIPLMTR